MIAADVEDTISEKFAIISPELDERSRRVWAAAEARSLGHGGIAAVARATGLSELTIRFGLEEIEHPVSEQAERRIRRPGAGRKRIGEHDPEIYEVLESIVDATSRGDPENPLRWTTKSTRRLAEELSAQGHAVSHAKVGQLLVELDYSLQAPAKVREGKQHVDRDAQFQYINAVVRSFQQAHQPVISVDCKKKELVGDFSNKGREYQRKGEPLRVRTHDFEDEDLGKAIPYGVYDMTRNCGWVSVGVDHETSEFAVESIRQWWRHMGKDAYPQASQLLITADSGGSNGARRKLWKAELQRLANETGMEIHVCHLPPGTSKWNKIEHRMFSQITKNWRGKPLVSLETVVKLISSTSTKTGLRIKAKINPKSYPKGIEVSEEEMTSLNLKPDKFHGDWNYALHPH